MTVEDRDLGYSDLLHFLEDLDRNEPGIYVGVRQSEAMSVVDEDSGFTLGELAAVHEFGSSDGTIPERSFLRSTADENQAKYANEVDKALTLAVTGDRGLETSFNRIGSIAASDVQRKIKDGPFTPNTAATIAAKGSSTPLIDTGRLRQSIDYEIREGD